MAALRVAIAAFGGEFLIEFECLFELAEFLLKNGSALEHGGAGLGAFGILADELGPFLDGLAVAGGDFLLRAFRFFEIERLGLMHGTEQIEDSRRAFIERMGAQERVETLHRELLLLAGEGIEAHLELGVDDRVLAFRPLGAVRIVLHISLPGGDGFFVFLLAGENLSDAEQRAHFQVGQMGGGGGAEFLVHGGGGIAFGQAEALGCHEIAIGGDRIVRTAGGLQASAIIHAARTARLPTGWEAR